jgi:molybdopterin-guanine dinucleotide biosynthesis protein A
MSDLVSLGAQYEAQIDAPDGRRVCIGLLTGGKSTRMGQDKATTSVAGRTMIERVAAAGAATGLDVVVLGPDDAGTGLEAVPDGDDVPAGPLGGLLTLLDHRPDHHVLLVATDQPFVRPETLLHLALEAGGDIVVPIDQDMPQVTCARYGPAVIEHRDAWRLRALLDRVEVVRVEPERWRTWGEDGRSFRSLDRPEDIAVALDEYGTGDSPN